MAGQFFEDLNELLALTYSRKEFALLMINRLMCVAVCAPFVDARQDELLDFLVM